MQKNAIIWRQTLFLLKICNLKCLKFFPTLVYAMIYRHRERRRLVLAKIVSFSSQLIFELKTGLSHRMI